MRFAIKTSPQETTWADMLAVWQAADALDVFESGWTFDHFYPIFGDPTGPCLEGWTTLAALAQACVRQFRLPSAMADMINAGEDLHAAVAGLLLGRPAAAVTRDERARAKAVNFGLPAGMGNEALQQYAKAAFRVILGPAQAGWCCGRRRSRTRCSAGGSRARRLRSPRTRPTTPTRRRGR